MRHVESDVSSRPELLGRRLLLLLRVEGVRPCENNLLEVPADIILAALLIEKTRECNKMKSR